MGYRLGLTRKIRDKSFDVTCQLDESWDNAPK